MKPLVSRCRTIPVGRTTGRRSIAVVSSIAGWATMRMASACGSKRNSTSGASDRSETYSRPSCISRLPRNPRRPPFSRSSTATSASSGVSAPRRYTSTVSRETSLTNSSRYARWSDPGCANSAGAPSRNSAAARARMPLGVAGSARGIERLLQHLLLVRLHGHDEPADLRTGVLRDLELVPPVATGEHVPALRLFLEELLSPLGKALQSDGIDAQVHVAGVLHVDGGAAAPQRQRGELVVLEGLHRREKDGNSHARQHPDGGARLRLFGRGQLLEEDAIRLLDGSERDQRTDAQAARLADLELEDDGEDDDLLGRSKFHPRPRILVPGHHRDLIARIVRALVAQRQQRLR